MHRVSINHLFHSIGCNRNSLGSSQYNASKNRHTQKRKDRLRSSFLQSRRISSVTSTNMSQKSFDLSSTFDRTNPGSPSLGSTVDSTNDDFKISEEAQDDCLPEDIETRFSQAKSEESKSKELDSGQYHESVNSSFPIPDTVVQKLLSADLQGDDDSNELGDSDQEIDTIDKNQSISDRAHHQAQLLLEYLACIEQRVVLMLHQYFTMIQKSEKTAKEHPIREIVLPNPDVSSHKVYLFIFF